MNSSDGSRRGRDVSGPSVRLLLELLDGLRSDRREEVYEVPIRVSKQERAVAPGHRCRFLDQRVLDHVCQFAILGVDVVDEKLDDRRVIVGGASNVSAEQLQRSRAADRQSRGWRVELCEIFREHRKGRSGDPLVEANETLDVSSDDAGGNEVHGVLLKLTLTRMASRRDLFWIADIRRPHQAAPASSSKYARRVRGSRPRIARSVSALPSRLCRSYQSNIGFIAVSCRLWGESAGAAVEASS